VIALASIAWAGPLDAPDPGDMGKYRCEEHPIGLDNPYSLGERKIVQTPPGDPTFAAGLQGKLSPITTDKDLDKASKGAGQHAAPAVASLVSGGQVVRRNCENRATTTDHYFIGCKVAMQCEVLVRLGSESFTFDRRPMVGARAAPVESVAEAVGLVWFLDPDLFLPLSPGEFAAWAEERVGYDAVEPALPWLEVEEHDQGYLVRAPRKVGCGCDHDVVRRAYWVSKDGRSCPVIEPGQALAVAKSKVCVD
jgi:hypothetical protein